MLTDFFFFMRKNLRVKQIVILKTYYRFEVIVLFFFLSGVTLKKFISLCLTVLGLSCGVCDFQSSLWHVGS